mmetsp:Transcript_38095/g.108193  ORF Transcript_38095/g.108193 Transcript_38095/m.108193 type:complete len:225 (+) Transcript_38095:640-1314(+)
MFSMSPGCTFSTCWTTKSISVMCPCPLDGALIVRSCSKDSTAKPSALPREVPELRKLPTESTIANILRIRTDVLNAVQASEISLAAVSNMTCCSWYACSNAHSCSLKLYEGTWPNRRTNASASSHAGASPCPAISLPAWCSCASSAAGGALSLSSSTWSRLNISSFISAIAWSVAATFGNLANMMQICRRRCSSKTCALARWPRQVLLPLGDWHPGPFPSRSTT